MSLWISFVYGLLVFQGSIAIDMFSARRDFLSATSAWELGQNNIARYPSYWSDVMFYAPYRGFQFHCFTATENGLSQSRANVLSQMRTDGRTKLAVYGPRGEGTVWTVGIISQVLALDLVAPNKYDERAAETVNHEVRNILRSRGYDPRVIIVYFVGDEFPEEGLFIHPDSPVASHTVYGVELVYCPVSGWGCFMQRRSRSEGKYKIFVYP